MTKVERIYEIEDYMKDAVTSGKFALVDTHRGFLDILNLANEKNNLYKSLVFEINIQALFNKIKPIELQRQSDIYCKTMIDKSFTRHHLKSDNLIKLIEFVIEQGFVKHINGITRITKAIVDNFDTIKSHEHSNQLIQLLSTDDERNIELVIIMLGLIEFDLPFRS